MSKWLKVESLDNFPLPYDKGRGVWMPFEYKGQLLLIIDAKKDLEEAKIPFTVVKVDVSAEELP